MMVIEAVRSGFRTIPDIAEATGKSEAYVLDVLHNYEAVGRTRSEWFSTDPALSAQPITEPRSAIAAPANLLADLACQTCGVIGRRIVTTGDDPYCLEHPAQSAILLPPESEDG